MDVPFAQEFDEEKFREMRRAALNGNNLWVPNMGTWELSPEQVAAYQQAPNKFVADLIRIPVVELVEFMESPDGLYRCGAKTAKGKICRNIVATGQPDSPYQWAKLRGTRCHTHGGFTRQGQFDEDQRRRQQQKLRDHAARMRWKEERAEQRQKEVLAKKMPRLNGRVLHVPYADDFPLSDTEFELFKTDPVELVLKKLDITESDFRAWLSDPNYGVAYCNGQTVDGRRCNNKVPGKATRDLRVWLTRKDGYCTFHQNQA